MLSRFSCVNIARGPRGLKYPTAPIIANRNKNKVNVPKRNFSEEVIATTVVGGIAFTAFTAYRYKISSPDQYLVRTGLGIKDMIISKKGFQWPFQKFSYIDMHPRNYSFNLHAMSNQKMEFILPGVFTIGPRDDPEALANYARYLLDDRKMTTTNEDGEEVVQTALDTSRVDALIEGVIEGETRVLAAMMTIEEIFNDRAAFKSRIIKNVQDELDQFGLQIFNANIKELQDAPGSEYFQYMRQQTRSEAESKSLIDIAEAKRKADIGQKEREADSRIKIASFEAAAVEKENENRQLIAKSNAELGAIEAEAKRRIDIANIEARAAANSRDAELQKEVEQRKIAQETEALRAKDYTRTQVTAEMAAKEAEGVANAIRLRAEAELYQQEQHARGVLAVYNAQSEGINNMIASFGGNRDALIQYLMLDKNVYVDLAKENAQAIQGLNPKITVWKTGGDDKKDPIRDVLQMVPPLVSTIHDQTGIKPGKWLMEIPENN